ncbi:MAG: carboxy-S-adenosyl-L-methionine synthase CmoA [Alphaproteobacteria bacterium]
MTERKIIGLTGERAKAAELNRDRLFAEEKPLIEDFRFGKETASVFDDMVDRSVPYYQEIQRMTGELAAEFAVPGTSLYDLGCATGTTLLVLDGMVDPGVRFVGVDNSDDMLEKARQKLEARGVERAYELMNADLNNCQFVENASVAVMILTLQFVRPLYRERAMRRICEGLNENGCLILVEKITLQDSLLNRLFIKSYYEMKKRNGYSNTEIVLKREALENVLIPYRYDENRDMLHEAGFRQVEEFFRWYNFCGVIAVK